MVVKVMDMPGNELEIMYSNESMELISRTMAVGLPAIEHFLKKKMKNPWGIYNSEGLLIFSSNGFKAAEISLDQLPEAGCYYSEAERTLFVPVFQKERNVQLFLTAEKVTIGMLETVRNSLRIVVPSLISFFGQNCYKLSEKQGYYNRFVTFAEFGRLIDGFSLPEGLYNVTVVCPDIITDEETWKSGYDRIWQMAQLNHHVLYPLGFNGFFIGVLYAGKDMEHSSLEYNVHISSRLRYLSSQFGLPCSGGMGNRYPKEQLAQSYKEAVYAYALGRAFGKLEFFNRYSELGVYTLFFGLGRNAINDCCSRITAPLAEHDCEKDSELEKTLTTLVDSDFNIKQTTEKLQINKTTLYYRIRSIEKLLGESVTSDIGRINAVFAVKCKYILEYTEAFER